MNLLEKIKKAKEIIDCNEGFCISDDGEGGIIITLSSVAWSGDDNGDISLSTLEKLKKIFPNCDDIGFFVGEPTEFRVIYKSHGLKIGIGIGNNW